MDFLKKHYEKILLVVSLLVLLGTAAWFALRIGQLTTELEAAPQPPALAGENLTPWPLHPYSNALAVLQSPPQWEKNPQPLFPVSPTVATNIIVIDTKELPFTVRGVRREPFKLLFKAYSFDATKNEAYNFQINMQFRPLTFFVLAVGDTVSNRVENTGFKIMKFERKLREVQDATVGGRRMVDESELTLRHGEEEPIVMILGQETFAREPVTEIQCDDDPNPQVIRRGQSFICKGNTYNVIDMRLEQMLIEEKATGKKHEINLVAGTNPAAKTSSGPNE